MKIERLENDKIKVTLTLEELIFYDLSGDNVRPDSPKLHKFLFDIMESVREQTGFNPNCGQVVVEAIKDQNGITLFISKLRSFSDIRRQDYKNKKIKSVKLSKNIHKNRFCFNNFNSLCEVLKIIPEESLEAGVLYKYNEKWYITVPSKNTMLNSVLREYCDYLKENISDVFLKVHGKIIAKGEKLISLVKGVKALD